jgi:hypothetical protein
MIAAYQSAQTYADRGQLTQRQRQGGQSAEETVDFAVTFERPNRLLLKAYRAVVNCDGTNFRAQITDEPSGNLDGQIVVRPAPDKMTLGDLYEEGERVDPVLAEAISGDLGVVPVQLNLLMADQPLAELLDASPPLERLPDATIETHPCARVSVNTESGKLVFWIDRNKFILRRLEYPAAEFPGDPGQTAGAGEFQLVADFKDARLDPTLRAHRFEWDVPSTARQVRYFVIPPQPLPTKMLGRRIGEFWFSDLDGDRVRGRDLTNKATVLVWYQEHPLCEQALRQLQQVYLQFADNDAVLLRVVSVDGPTYSHRDVQAVLDRWGVTVPALRDVAPCGPDLFGIADAPTLVVLDADGVLQYCEVGANPQLAEQLPQVIERILRSDPLGREILDLREERQRLYEEQLAQAMGEQPTSVVRLADAKLAARSDPQYLKLVQLWRCEDLKAPGNILPVDSPQQPRFLVLDGWRSVAEIDADGKLLAHRQIPLPERAAISHLRTAADSQGRRWFAGFEVHGRQVFLFDEQWKMLLAYPEERQRHDGIADAQIADLAGDAAPQLFVGFLGIVGVHAVSPAGQNLWRCRETASITSLTVSGPDEVGMRRLLVTSDQGTILPVNRYGNSYPEIRVGRRPIHGLAAAPFPAPAAAPYCGLSFDAQGRAVAVGINREMDDLWDYPLPSTVFRTQIEPIASAKLLSDAAGFWIFVGADGTVHFVTADGQLTDRWGYGRQVTGVAAARIGNRGIVVLADGDGGVAGFRVERRQR